MAGIANILQKIYKASIKFLSPLTLEETYALIVKEAMGLVKAEYASIFLYQDSQFSRVYTNRSAFYKIVVRKRGTTYRVFRTGKPVIVNYSTVARNPRREQYRKLGIFFKSDLMIPISYHGETLGVLSLMSIENLRFTQKDIEILTLLMPLASISIRKAQLTTELKNALEARDLFISMAAHELRTPITTISGYAQLLYGKLGGKNTSESRWISDLSWETLRLTYLINELLEVDRIKSGQFQYYFKECGLKEIIRRGLSDFSMTHPDHSIAFTDNIPASRDSIIGDFNKILQVIINLLDNAAKFSPPDKEIRLTAVRNSKYFILTLKDFGKGIAKEDLGKIYNKFYRGSEHSIEGMGIGLFLVKNILREHHGTIEIKSKQNKGTTTIVKLPVAKKEQEALRERVNTISP